jgi:hypothetical protein
MNSYLHCRLDRQSILQSSSALGLARWVVGLGVAFCWGVQNAKDKAGARTNRRSRGWTKGMFGYKMSRLRLSICHTVACGKINMSGSVLNCGKIVWLLFG